MIDLILLSARKLIGTVCVTPDDTYHRDLVLLSVYADTYEKGSWFSVIRHAYRFSYGDLLSEEDVELHLGNIMNGQRIPVWLRSFLWSKGDAPIEVCDWYDLTPTGM